MKLSLFFKITGACVFSVLFFCCGGYRRDNEDEAIYGKLFKPYKDSLLTVSVSNKVQWKGNSGIKTSAIIQTKKLIFEMNFSHIDPSLYGFDVEKYYFADLKYSISFNNENLVTEFSDYKRNMKSGRLYENMNDSSGIFYEEKSLKENFPIKIIIPLYFARKFEEGKMVTVQIRVWQDYFLSRKRNKPNEPGKVTMEEIRDTLKTKLIDNVYSISFKMPAVYKTEIICDSLILQNDTSWSPGGSDNTLFKSSYPDLFYSVDDYGYFTQSTSHIEKSTDKFEEGDTLVLYRYKPHEPFDLRIFDYDFLSKNDQLADTMLDPEQLPNNKTSILKFGHVSRFYLRKKDHGKIN